MASFCTQCGTPLEGSNVCPQCGHVAAVESHDVLQPAPEPVSQPAPSPAPVPEPVPQPVPVQPLASKLAPAQTPASTSSNSVQPGQETKITKILIGAIAALALAIVAALLVLQPWKANSNSLESTSATSVAAQTSLSSVAGTLEETGADAGSTGEAESTEAAAEPAEVSSTLVEEVTPTYWFEYGQVAEEENYSYLQIYSDSEDANKVLASLNLAWVEEVGAAYANKYVEGSQPNGDANTSYGNTVTYFEDGVVGVNTSQYMYSGGAHGYVALNHAVYILETGEKTTAYDYIGVSRDAVEQYGRAALDAFLSKNGGTNSMLYADSNEVFEYSSFWGMVENGALVLELTPDGLVMFCNHYVIGPYAAGVTSLLLCDGEGNQISPIGDPYELPEIVSPPAMSSQDSSGENQNTSADAQAETASSVPAGPLDAYGPVLSEYKAVMESPDYPSATTYVNTHAWEEHYETNGIAQDRELSCALVDLAGDGIPELVIAYKFEGGGNGTGTSGSVATYRPYDFYSIQNGQAVRVLDDLGYAKVMYFHTDGTVHVFYSEVDGSFPRYTDEYYTEEADTGVLQFVESLSSVTVDQYDYRDGNGNETGLSQTAATKVFEHYRDLGIMEDIEWKPISDAASLGIALGSSR